MVVIIIITRLIYYGVTTNEVTIMTIHWWPWTVMGQSPGHLEYPDRPNDMRTSDEIYCAWEVIFIQPKLDLLLMGWQLQIWYVSAFLHDRLWFGNGSWAFLSICHNCCQQLQTRKKCLTFLGSWNGLSKCSSISFTSFNQFRENEK